jgi:hypothetical protein
VPNKLIAEVLIFFGVIITILAVGIITTGVICIGLGSSIILKYLGCASVIFGAGILLLTIFNFPWKELEAFMPRKK